MPKLNLRQLIDTPKLSLGPLDQQRRYLTAIWSRKAPCPNCAAMHSPIEVHQLDVNVATFDDLSAAVDLAAPCLGCKVKIRVTGPFFIGPAWIWTLGEKVKPAKGARP